MFDYVIAGGGSAGSVLAARLSEDPAVKVCLIEAGGSGRDLLLRVPSGAAAIVPGRRRVRANRGVSRASREVERQRPASPTSRAAAGSAARA